MYNNSSTIAIDTGIVVFTKSEDIIIKTLYVLISVIDIAANSAIIFMIAKDKRIQNTVNLLIINLSLSDIVAGFAIYPYLFVSISPDEKRADILCGLKHGQMMFLAAAAVNFLTLGVLSFSRYVLINHPTKVKWRIRKSQVKWISIASWFFGIALLSPNLVSYRYSPQEGLCRSYWPDWLNKPAFFSVTVILIVVPLASLTFTFASTVYTLWFKASSRRLARSNSVSGVQSSRRKVTILLGLLILALLICWLPFSVFWSLANGTSYFDQSTANSIKKLRLIRICLLFAFFNTILDPVIYALGNRQIKDKIRHTLTRANSIGIEPTNTAYD